MSSNTDGVVPKAGVSELLYIRSELGRNLTHADMTMPTGISDNYFSSTTSTSSPHIIECILPVSSADNALAQMAATAKEVMSDARKKPVHYPFWFGGSASCFAACVTHPLDLGM